MPELHSLNGFYLAMFKFHYVPLETLYLPPYKGAVLRGGFGSMLKRATCAVPDTPCQECLLQHRCAYCQIFETPVPEDSRYFEGQSYAPHPFVIEPPDETKTVYSPEDRLTFNLVLIGKAIDYLPYFVFAFTELGRKGLGERVEGKRGRCGLEKVESLKALGKESKAIFLGKTGHLLGEFSTITFEDILKERGLIADRIVLDFLTPTRIKRGGKLREEIDFEILMRSLLRRILALSYFHCGFEPDQDYKGLIERAKKVELVGNDLDWHDLSRYSRRQETRLFIGGFKGKIVFKGPLEEFLPFILLGEYIHIGKGTAFGLGKYRILSNGA